MKTLQLSEEQIYLLNMCVYSVLTKTHPTSLEYRSIDVLMDLHQKLISDHSDQILNRGNT
jgi:hypothetical protein